MYIKKEIWLTEEEIFKKYAGFYHSRNIDMKFMQHLSAANFLRCRNNNHTKKVEVLEEYLLELIKHIIHVKNVDLKIIQNEFESISVPFYVTHQRVNYANCHQEWYSPTELKDEFPAIRDNSIFTVEFINDLSINHLVLSKED